MIKILLFYKYVNINNPQEFITKHLQDCKALGLMGRILVAKEGINGSVSGSEERVEAYKKLLRSDERFSDIVFKEDDGLVSPFKRMVVKLKNEIVRFEKVVDLKNTGKHLTPAEFLELYNSEDRPVIIDARNDYEFRVGRFKDATPLPIRTFKEFPKAVLDLNIPKSKKIVMYCTGGVRCEKASAFMKENGYEDVSQLSGGIISFGKEFPDTVWDGKLFVFDKRLVSSINKDDIQPITNCEVCNTSCDLYKNCRNVNCDKYCIICITCDDELSGCCSRECAEEFLESRMRGMKVHSVNKLKREE